MRTIFRAIWSMYRAVMKGICLAWFRLRGWKLEGREEHQKYILIAAPHTTNWDVPCMLAVAYAMDLHLSWMGKDQLFRVPGVRNILKWMGGIPVRRDKSTGAVDQMAERFAAPGYLAIAVAPEGTRKLVPRWRSGFYHIALRAQVPIVMGYIDWGNKRAGLGPSIVPTGNVTADMDVLRAFYADKLGYNPELFGPVRLKEEDVAADGAAPVGAAAASGK